MADIELTDLILQHEINEKIEVILLPKDEADKKNAIIEKSWNWWVRSKLFASDLFKMYEKVSHKKMVFELISISRSDAGGLKKL